MEAHTALSSLGVSDEEAVIAWISGCGAAAHVKPTFCSCHVHRRAEGRDQSSRSSNNEHEKVAHLEARDVAGTKFLKSMGEPDAASQVSWASQILQLAALQKLFEILTACIQS